MIVPLYSRLHQSRMSYDTLQNGNPQNAGTAPYSAQRCVLFSRSDEWLLISFSAFNGFLGKRHVIQLRGCGYSIHRPGDIPGQNDDEMFLLCFHGAPALISSLLAIIIARYLPPRVEKSLHPDLLSAWRGSACRQRNNRHSIGRPADEGWHRNRCIDRTPLRCRAASALV